MLLPVSLKLPAGFDVALTPEVDAAVNASGQGRHLAYGTTAGLSHSLGDSVTIATEMSFFQDQDPAGHSVLSLAVGEIAWRPNGNWQLDAEIDLGLSAAAPRHAIIIGFARRL